MLSVSCLCIHHSTKLVQLIMFWHLQTGSVNPDSHPQVHRNNIILKQLPADETIKFHKTSENIKITHTWIHLQLTYNNKYSNLRKTNTQISALSTIRPYSAKQILKSPHCLKSTPHCCDLKPPKQNLLPKIKTDSKNNFHSSLDRSLAPSAVVSNFTATGASVWYLLLLPLNLIHTKVSHQ